MRPLVILRPEPGASATARSAGRMGLEAVVIPLFAVEPIDWQPPDPAGFDAMLVTSANAIRRGGSGLDRLRALTVHCVGEATARDALNAGFQVGTVGTSGVGQLLESLPHGLSLLHLCGVDRIEPARPAQSITAIPVYGVVEIPAGVRFGEIEGSVVALHSPRAACVFARRVDGARLERSTIAVAAISAQTATSAGNGWNRVEVAPEPSDSAILAIAARLCNNAG